MAIKPNDLANNEDVKATADRIEQEIDHKIAVQAKDFDGKRITISIGYPGKNVLDELKRRYINAGWTTFQYHSDQRDSYLELTA